MSASAKDSLIELFKQAAEGHHEKMIAGETPNEEWPMWYAGFLREKIMDHLPGIDSITQSELVYLLVMLDKKLKAEDPDAFWPSFYADYFLEHYA